MLYNKTFEDGVIQFNNARSVEGFKQEEVERVYLTVEEIKKMPLLVCIHGLKSIPILLPWVYVKSDIEKLLWSEVQDFDGFTRIVFRQKKTKAQEYLDINEQNYFNIWANEGKPTDRVFSSFQI